MTWPQCRAAVPEQGTATTMSYTTLAVRSAPMWRSTPGHVPGQVPMVSAGARTSRERSGAIHPWTRVGRVARVKHGRHVHHVNVSENCRDRSSRQTKLAASAKCEKTTSFADIWRVARAKQTLPHAHLVPRRREAATQSCVFLVIICARLVAESRDKSTGRAKGGPTKP